MKPEVEAALVEQEQKYRQSPSPYLHGMINGMRYVQAIEEDKLNTDWYLLDKLYT